MTYLLHLLVFSLSLWLLFFGYSSWIKIARRLFYKKLSFRLSEEFSNDKLILDVGSGTGFFAEMIKNKISGQIICLDLYDYNKNSAPFVIADANHLPFSNGSFDTITLFYVLHHSDYPKNLLAEVCRVSRSRVIIHEDVYTNLFEKIMYQIHIWSFSQFYQLSGKKVMTDNEWLKLFVDLNLKVVNRFSIKRLGYPVSRREYILTLNNT